MQYNTIFSFNLSTFCVIYVLVLPLILMHLRIMLYSLHAMDAHYLVVKFSRILQDPWSGASNWIIDPSEFSFGNVPSVYDQFELRRLEPCAGRDAPPPPPTICGRRRRLLLIGAPPS